MLKWKNSLHVNISYKSLAYPFVDVNESNIFHDLQEREVLYDNYSDMDETPYIELPKHKSEISTLCSSDDFIAPHNSFQVFNDVHSNIPLDTCYDQIFVDPSFSFLDNALLVNTSFSLSSGFSCM
jgi:hypothetical protein